MSEDESAGMFNMDSKFMRTTLVIVAVLLIFAGPTYIPYVLSNILHLDYFASVIAGLALLVAGIGLLWFLIHKKVIV
jgi:hypothetical protein